MPGPRFVPNRIRNVAGRRCAATCCRVRQGFAGRTRNRMARQGFVPNGVGNVGRACAAAGCFRSWHRVGRRQGADFKLRFPNVSAACAVAGVGLVAARVAGCQLNVKVRLHDARCSCSLQPTTIPTVADILSAGRREVRSGRLSNVTRCQVEECVRVVAVEAGYGHKQKRPLGRLGVNAQRSLLACRGVILLINVMRRRYRVVFDKLGCGQRAVRRRLSVC